MVIGVRDRAVTDKALIFEMRRAGAPMREIGQKAGISKQRVSQILSRTMGSTKHQWLSTTQLCEMTDLTREKVLRLQERGVISPVSEWNVGARRYVLWPPECLKTVAAYYSTHHLCQVCGKPLAKYRKRFCSDTCRQERHKYKNMTREQKQKVLANIRRYRERKLQESQELIYSELMRSNIINIH